MWRTQVSKDQSIQRWSFSSSRSEKHLVSFQTTVLQPQYLSRLCLTLWKGRSAKNHKQMFNYQKPQLPTNAGGSWNYSGWWRGDEQAFLCQLCLSKAHRVGLGRSEITETVTIWRTGCCAKVKDWEEMKQRMESESGERVREMERKSFGKRKEEGKESERKIWNIKKVRVIYSKTTSFSNFRHHGENHHQLRWVCPWSGSVRPCRFPRLCKTTGFLLI